MTDALGDRMKTQYEDRTRTYLPRRTYTIIRVDGKAFHTYTRGFERPFDFTLISAMNDAAMYLCSNIDGAQLAFVQSDEISVLVTDFARKVTSAYFDGSVQKIASISASMASARFNKSISDQMHPAIVDGPDRLAVFDGRCFTIPDPTEVENYFIWRQNDWTRNSIQMVARTFYSHKELNHKSTNEQQEMIFQKGTNWNNCRPDLKRGRAVIRVHYTQEQLAKAQEEKKGLPSWKRDDVLPIFTRDREYLKSKIPSYEDAE